MKLKLLVLFMLLASASVNAQVPKDCLTCSTELINPKQLEGMTIPQLQRLKDDVYARKGYRFINDKTAEYFSQHSWYKPVQRNSLLFLNEIEKKNVALIDDEIEGVFDAFSQSVASDNGFLAKNEIDRLLSSQVKKYLGILFYNTRNVYSYKDGSKIGYLILSENQYDSFNDSRSLYNDYIKAICSIREGDFLLKTYEINDLIDTKKGELDIRFLPKYISVDDIDGDGSTDPIIVYGGMGEQGYHNGWVKILILHNGSPYTIYVNNSENEEKQMISLNTDFYALPDALLQKIFSLLKLLGADGYCYYPQGWEDMYNRRSTLIW